MIEEEGISASPLQAGPIPVVVDQLPLTYTLAVAAAKAAVIAAQVHLFVELKKRQRVRGPGAANWLGPVFILSAFALVLPCDFFNSERSLITDWSPPATWRGLSTVWVAGSVPAYLLFLAYLGWRRVWKRRFQATPPVEFDRLSREGSKILTRRDLVSNAARAALGVPFAVAGYGTFIARTKFEVRPVEVKIPNLPASLDGLRLVQLSDIHFGPNLASRELERAVAMANEPRPHLAVVTGDLITRAGDPLEKCLDVLAGFKAEAGVWACMGNHEHYAEGEDHCENYARSLGIDFLRQRSQILRFGDADLNLCGVDYQRTSRPYLENGRHLLRSDCCNVLLSHNPDVFPVAAQLGYDLVLSGHTHGGQITVEIVEQWANPGRFFTPFVAGEYRLDHSALYVSRGIGTVNLAMRVGALPEISLLTLRRA